MSKFIKLQEAVFGLISGPTWSALAIPTVPRDMFLDSVVSEFVRVSIIPSGNSLNNLSISGLLMLEIFTPADQGPARATTIADLLDSLFVKKTVVDGTSVTQFGNASLVYNGKDTANPGLVKSTLSIPVNHFGVL